MITSVLHYLERASVKYENKPAFIDECAALTFGEITARARAIGSFLAKYGLRNMPVAVMMPKCAASIAAFLGAAYSGNFYCPIDVSMPKSRIDLIFHVLKPAAVIADRDTEKLAASIDFSGEVLLYERISQTPHDELMLQKILKSRIDTDPLYCMFTSGSTGIPKGVLIPDRAVVDYTEWVAETFSITEDDVFGNQAPFHFDNSVLDIYSAIKNGSTMHIIPTELFAFPIKLLDYLNRNKITVLFWVPSALCTVANLKALHKIPPAHIKKVLFAGEVMPNKQLNIWRRALPDVRFTNLYGPTEITDVCTYYEVNRKFPDDAPLPIGIPCDNADIIILDENDRPIGRDGSVGELCVRGTCLALGYYNNPEKTAEVFVQNPLNPSYPEKIYRTGDLVRYNTYGEIEYVTRKDFQIKHKGHRIELGEIETAASAIPEITACACIYDNERKKIVCFYSGVFVEAGQIAKTLSSKISDYMIPGKYVFLDDLPLNANGKIDRKKLREEYL
jgi:amino acid adenylation domain-containing protein